MMDMAFPIDAKFGQLIWERCAIGLAEVGLKGEWLAANPTLCSLLEYTESELQARTFQQVTHPDDVDDDVHMVERLQAGSIDHYVMSKRYITKRGDVIWIKLRVDPVSDDDGKVIFFLSQIVPADAKKRSPGLIEREYETRRSLRDFIAAEWKWLLAALIAVIGFVSQQHAMQQTNRQEVSALKESVKALTKRIDEQK